MQQPTKQTVAEVVRKYIKDQPPDGATFEVIAPGIRKERSWWYVPVRPNVGPVKRYEYYETLAWVEESSWSMNTSRCCWCRSVPRSLPARHKMCRAASRAAQGG